MIEFFIGLIIVAIFIFICYGMGYLFIKYIVNTEILYFASIIEIIGIGLLIILLIIAFIFGLMAILKGISLLGGNFIS